MVNLGHFAKIREMAVLLIFLPQFLSILSTLALAKIGPDFGATLDQARSGPINRDRARSTGIGPDQTDQTRSGVDFGDALDRRLDFGDAPITRPSLGVAVNDRKDVRTCNFGGNFFSRNVFF
jgi:hypothetical protein